MYQKSPYSSMAIGAILLAEKEGFSPVTPREALYILGFTSILLPMVIYSRAV